MTALIDRAPREDDLWKRIGDWLQRHQRAIRLSQWTVVVIYFTLLTVPAVLPLPGSSAFIWNNFTRFAQFAFWGIWWPFVLLSTALVGRVWCGMMCPEGAVTEFASRHGRGRAIPRWIQWAGWPTAAFACTTIYGQMISVYQYPLPALLILGGSTAGAAAIGYLYGKNKRVWCRYLCPVSGVFGLLSKLAPLHFQTDPALWRLSQRDGVKPGAVNCAPLLPLRTMESSSACHMCGRCSGFRGAIRLARRSPSDEIINVAGKHTAPWETVLIVFGLMGIAMGAFQWSASPWFVTVKEAIAGWLVDRDITWPLERTLPWWMLTDYPAKNDVLSLLDGGLLVSYIGVTAVLAGGVISLCLAAATLCLGRWQAKRLHHLAQTLIPLAGAGVFLGLSALTVSQLRMDGIDLPLVHEARAAILAAATLWCLYLCWRVTALYNGSVLARVAALAMVGGALAIADAGWFLLFWVW